MPLRKDHLIFGCQSRGVYPRRLSGRTADKPQQRPTNEDILWQIQCNVIADLAKKGLCVIVGRCADFILKDRPDVLKVFIHADMAFRAKRIVEEYGERTETPEQRLKDKDKRRSTYYRFYTGQKWGQVQSYDMTLNSGKLGIEKCAELICTILA